MGKFLIIIAISIVIALPANAQDRCAIEAVAWAEAEPNVRPSADNAYTALMSSNRQIMASAKQHAASIGILLLHLDGLITCDEIQRKIDAYNEFAYWAMLASSLMGDAELAYIAASANDYNLFDNLADRIVESYYNLDTPFNFGQRS